MERIGDWISTFSGKQFWPCDPRPEEIDIADIAHHLSNLCRFTGAVKSFYCVTPETRVLTRDFRGIEAGAIRSSDVLWGFDESSHGPRNLRKWREQ